MGKVYRRKSKRYPKKGEGLYRTSLPFFHYKTYKGKFFRCEKYWYNNMKQAIHSS